MKDAQETLERVIVDVLERFAFMFAETCEESRDAVDGGYAVELTFSGPDCGSLRIAANDVMCRELAVNVLGADDVDELDPSAPGDALKELANIVLGQLVADLFGEKAVFGLSIPTLLTCVDNAPLQDEVASVALLVDDEPMIASLAVAERPVATSTVGAV
jgi:CheY-specific phosphatase CheX